MKRRAVYVALSVWLFTHCGPARKGPVGSVATPQKEPVLETASIEGYVRDKETGAGVAGVEVDGGINGEYLKWATTDENGRFTLPVRPPQAELFLHIGEAKIHRSNIPATAGTTTKIDDLVVEHTDLLLERERHPPLNCPGSLPGAIVEGHTTSQADIDDLVGAALARFVVDPDAIPDHGLLAKGKVSFINTTIDRDHRISSLAVKASPIPLVGKSYDDLQDLANRTRKEINFIDFSKITSDGTCAFVDVGVDFTMPASEGGFKMCCCIGHDIYEKRAGRWVFVRSEGVSCA